MTAEIRAEYLLVVALPVVCSTSPGYQPTEALLWARVLYNKTSRNPGQLPAKDYIAGELYKTT
jgi:hypothetical protein